MEAIVKLPALVCLATFLQCSFGLSIIHEDEHARIINYNDTLEPPSDHGEFPIESSYKGAIQIPDSISVPMAIWYDTSLWRAHSYNHIETENWLLGVLNITRELLQHPSLGVKIYLNVVKIGYIDLELRADTKDLEYLRENDFVTKNLLNVFFCSDPYPDYPGGQRYSVGRASTGAACDNRGYNAIMVEHDPDEMEAAKIFVHELSHSLGMR